MTTETLLCKVYVVRPQKNEDRQTFLGRLVEKINNGSDDDWEQLTDEAQQWFNSAVKPWSAGKTIPDFQEAEDDEEDDEGNEDEADNEREDQQHVDSSEDDEEEEATMATSKTRKKRSDMATKKKKKTETVAKKKVSPAAKRTGGKKVSRTQTGPLGPSGEAVVKRAMLRNMRATVEDLNKALKKEGRELSPVRLSLIRASFRHSIRLLQEEGKLKDKYIV